MPRVLFQNVMVTIFLTGLLGHAGVSSAHNAGAVMDSNGNAASFTGYAAITCSNDESGTIPTDYLEANIRDLSPPQENLLVNMQLIKGNRAINISDPVSGDADASPTVILQGGNGVYLILVNKTGAGARAFEVNYHCKGANGVHTVTDIVVYQFE